MELTRTAKTILSVTALAWAIPLAQAEDKAAPRLGNAKFIELDANRDGKLDAIEFIKAESLHDRAYAGRVANDSAITAKVKAALLREPELRSLDVSIETFKGEVLLSGFVKDPTQRAKAVKAASAVAGVTGVKDGLSVRN